MKVFAMPEHEQEEEVLFNSLMFLVVAGGAAISWLLMVCMSVMVDYGIVIVCEINMAALMLYNSLPAVNIVNCKYAINCWY